MTSIYALKEATVAATPILCFEIQLWDGYTLRFASQAITIEGQSYEKRIVAQQLHDSALGGDDAIGYYARVTFSLANTDGLLTQIESTRGFRGATVTVRFVFLEPGDVASTVDAIVVFRGIADGPSLIDEIRLTLSAENRFARFHAKLPATPIQRRCPWHFPYDSETRMEAATGAEDGPHSLFYRCGYSPDVAGGSGSLDGSIPFNSCQGTRDDCGRRGMLNEDALHRATRRFGGFTYLPPSILVRTHGSRSLQPAEVYANQANGNDIVPLVYGKGWLVPPLIHSANDGNLTRLLYVVADGEIDGIERLIVNGVEIPAAVEGRDMTSTGWYKILASGSRTGTFLPKPDNDGVYTESDPHGSMTTLLVVIPNAMHKGSGKPKAELLLRGLRLLKVSVDGETVERLHTDNPAWVMLDLLLRSGWRRAELHLPSFAIAAQHCSYGVQVGLWNGITQTQPRFSCNLVLQKRRSVGELLRGLREGSCLFLRERFDGKLELVIESTLAQQQASKSEFSNAASMLSGGWPTYEFGDGTEGRGGILRAANGAPNFRLFSKPLASCPNRIHAEFQDLWNDLQTDRISLFDSREIRRSRQEISASSKALGLSTYHQAARSVYLQLKRSIDGNRFVEFQTGLRGIGIRPGDLITVTYTNYGLARQLFRVIKVRPSENLQSAWITAQWHDDSWFADTIMDEIGGLDRYRNPASIYGTPRPLSGSLVQLNGTSAFDINETPVMISDGSYRVTINCGFLVPPRRLAATLPTPLCALAPTVTPSGALPSGETYYYRLSAANADGDETALTSPIGANAPSAGVGYAVSINAISAPPEAAVIHVYRGISSDIMYRIATLAASAGGYSDTGAEYLPIVPVDPNFDHANFYWRGEIYPATAVSAAGASIVVSATSTWDENQFQGKIVRILSGKGSAQERTVLSNNANTLFVDRWAVPPDSSSTFAIVEPVWNLGGKVTSSPASFDVPNQAGSVVHVLGVAANALDLEAPIDRAVITRWQIGGGSVFPIDIAAPDQPFFTLGSDGAGMLHLSNIGFESLEHTQTIQSGTLQLYYYEELRDLPTSRLTVAATPAETEIHFDSEPGLFAGDHFQLGREILRVVDIGSSASLIVERGVLGSVAEEHAAGMSPFSLSLRGMAFAIPLQFFGSPASGAFRQSFYLPHARVAAAQLMFTNGIGPGAVGQQIFTPLVDYGLRSGYGGQYSLYVEGYLAIENDAAIPMIVDRDHSVRDVYATLESPPTAGPVALNILLDGALYCSLTFAQDSVFSNVVSGTFLQPLRAGSRISVDITSVVHYGNTIPGKDLSIRIRL